MILFAEAPISSNVTMTTLSKSVFAVSPDFTVPKVIIKDEIIIYSTQLSNVGIIIKDEPVLSYGISSL